ncbi:hypothetical protein F7C95_03690 [Opitutia bacterium ISCC 51]|nr:hypothetical protein F7C95_03690 [Opitutae bacterium ISCC 51]QXD29084.1 hypothetical protein GA003_03670 [Opitutae bacterium ISCC 52]
MEIIFSEDYGAHTSYFAYLNSTEVDPSQPLITANHNRVYPSEWLDRLMTAHQEHPSVIHCFDAKRIGINKYHFDPLHFWDVSQDAHPDRLNFLNTELGVIYPAEFLKFVKERGTGFRSVSPDTEDVWMSHMAFKEEVLIGSLQNEGLVFDPIPVKETYDLPRIQFMFGGAQIQLDQTYTREDRQKLFQLHSG